MVNKSETAGDGKVVSYDQVLRVVRKLSSYDPSIVTAIAN